MLSDPERRFCVLESLVEKLEKKVWDLEAQLEAKEAVMSHLLSFHYDPKKYGFKKLHPILKIGLGDFLYFSEDISLYGKNYICDIVPLEKFVEFFEKYMFLYEGTEELTILTRAIFVQQYVEHQYSEKFFFRSGEIEKLREVVDQLSKK